MADRVALMKTGSVEQIGTVNEILKHPVSRYAAEFTRTKNIFEGTSDLLENGRTAICLGNGISLNPTRAHSSKLASGLASDYKNVLFHRDGKIPRSLLQALSILALNIQARFWSPLGPKQYA